MDFMVPRFLVKVAPIAAAALAGCMFVLVLKARAPMPLAMRLPGTDNAVAAAGAGLDKESCRLRVIERDRPNPIQPAMPKGDWPNYRGFLRDNISPDSTPLAKAWPPAGPKQLWSVELGEGYASPAVHNGRVYILDYDPPDQWLLQPDDITDFKALADWTKTREKSSPGQRELLSLLAPGEGDIRTILTAANDDASRDAFLTRANQVLAMRDLYRKLGPLPALPLPPEHNRYLVTDTDKAGAKTFALRATITDAELLRLNRILIESVLGPLVAKSQHADVMRCLRLADGAELWRMSYPVKIKPNHGCSRTVPAVTDKYVVSLGPKCHLVCLNAVTGELVWGVDLVGRYQAEVPEWYAGQCPLIEDDRVIVAPGGSSLLVAFDIATGEVVWETPNPRRWKMTHSSIAVHDVGGKKMYVYCGGDNVSGGVVGVDADTGKALWESTSWRISTTVPSPLPLPEGKIFFCGGYGAGSLMMQIVETEGTFEAKELWRLKSEDFGSVQQTPIFWQDHIFGVRPDGELVCLTLDGQVKWTSGSTSRFGQGMGPYVVADGAMYLMNDTGTLTLAQVSPGGYQQLSQARVLPGHDSWGPLAVAAGRLLARDFNRMVCLDISARSTGVSPVSFTAVPAVADEQE